MCIVVEMQACRKDSNAICSMMMMYQQRKIEVQMQKDDDMR
jgi:hypothetical protein